MREENPKLSLKATRIPALGESKVQGFRLTEHPCQVGSVAVDNAEPSLFLVLTGELKLGAHRTFVPGDVTPCQSSHCVQSESGTKLWQITGAPEMLWELEHFATQLRRKDAATAAHSARVALLAASIGQHLDLSGERHERLGLAAYLHDLGKLKLPSRVLQTPASLTLAEWQLMVQHPSYGRQLLEPTAFAALAPLIEQHHERLNGSGYPFGLSGDAVHLESYVIAVADTFDAMTHARPYQGARSPQEALSELNRYSDTLYPREVVAALNAVTKTLSC